MFERVTPQIGQFGVIAGAIVLGLLLTFPKLCLAETIVISGSNTVGASLVPECAKAYLESQGATNAAIRVTGNNEFLVSAPGEPLKFAVRAHGSSTGFLDVANGSAQIAMASRPIKSKEVLALKDKGDMKSLSAEQVVAMDGLVILVNLSNPIKQLNIEQIARIFSGDIENWVELGGPDLKINLYSRDENSGTWDTFKSLVLRKRYQLHDKAELFESSDELSDRITLDPAGIGFTGMASVRGAKALAVADGDTRAVKPSRLSIATEDYPLSRRLFIYAPPNLKTPATDRFIEFCQSEHGQNIVAEVGFISQNIVAVTQAPALNAPSHYRELSSYADRLSINIRFQVGSTLLDNKSMKDIERLLQYLNQGDNAEKSVYLVGFSDPGKTDKRAQILSKYRALSVWSKLLNDKVRVQEAMSVGAFMPVTSGRDDVAVLKNSRVEVWIGKHS